MSMESASILRQSNVVDQDRLDIAILAAEVSTAKSQYEQALLDERAARRVTTDRLNSLRKTQNKFDGAIQKFKDGHPQDSNWGKRPDSEFAVSPIVSTEVDRS